MSKIRSFLSMVVSAVATLASLAATIYFANLFFSEYHAELEKARTHIVYACLLLAMCAKTLFIAFSSYEILVDD
jgi:hypothetical protein